MKFLLTCADAVHQSGAGPGDELRRTVTGAKSSLSVPAGGLKTADSEAGYEIRNIRISGFERASRRISSCATSAR
jgi:hypothetical protein